MLRSIKSWLWFPSHILFSADNTVPLNIMQTHSIMSYYMPNPDQPTRETRLGELINYRKMTPYNDGPGGGGGKERNCTSRVLALTTILVPRTHKLISAKTIRSSGIRHCIAAYSVPDTGSHSFIMGLLGDQFI
jgi:hypothetical protein